MDAIYKAHRLLRGPSNAWQRRCDAFTSAAAKARQLMRDATHEAETVLLDEEHDDLAGPAWEDLQEAAYTDAVRYDKILTQMGLAESAAPDLALYGYCSNLDGSQLLELAEALRPGLLEASAAWAQLAQATEGVEACSRGVKGASLQVLRAAVTGLLLLHGIPSAALEPWGGEGQGPEPLACAGVALIHITFQNELDDAIDESEEESMWTLSPPPGLIHYALCHGPIATSSEAQPYPPTRYSADHLDWLTDQLMDRGLAYLKETELLRACMTPMGAVPSATVLRRLSREAFALHADCAQRYLEVHDDGLKACQDGRLASPLLPDADLDLDLGRGLGPGLAPGRHGADGDGSEDWGGSYASVHSDAEEGSGGDEEFHNCRSGTESGAEDQTGPGPGSTSASPRPRPRPAPASPAPHGPPPRCCLFDPLWWWAGRDGPGHSHGGGSSSSGGGVNGSGGGPESTEPWEAELPWLAWLMGQGLLEAPFLGADALTALLTETLTSAERQAHAILRQAQAQAHRPLLEDAATLAHDEARRLISMRRTDIIRSLDSRRDLGPTMSSLVLGLPLPTSAAETAECLNPGLLAEHPRTWARLLRGRELAEGDPHAAHAARFGLLGLAALAGLACHPGQLLLSRCVAAGWLAADVLAKAAPCNSAQQTFQAWLDAAAMGTMLFTDLDLLEPLSYVRTAPGWTCAHDRDLGGVGGGGGVGGPGLRAEAGAVKPGAAIAHATLAFRGAPELMLLLAGLANTVVVEESARATGDKELMRRAYENRACAEGLLAALALKALEPGALERLKSRALAAAGSSGGGRSPSPIGPGPGPGPGPGVAQALVAAAGPLQAATHGAAAAAPEAAAALGSDATPCYGLGRDPAEARAALLRVAESSPVGGLSAVSFPQPPLQPQSLLLEGPEHATMVLALLENLTGRQRDGKEFCHPLVFFPEVVHGGTGGGTAAAGGGAGPGSRQRAAGAWDPKSVRVLIRDLQVGCLPVSKGLHKAKYPWAEMEASIPKVTPTSAAPKPRAAHLKEAKAALLDKGLGGIWVSGYGVVGTLGALMLAAEVRQEMRGVGRDCCVVVVHVNCTKVEELELEARRLAGAEACRGSKPGSSASIPAPPLDGSGAKPWAGLSALVGELASHLCTIRDVDILLRPYRALQDAGQMIPNAAVGAEFEAMARGAESELLGLLSDGPGGCGPLREGLQVQLRIMECVPGRPGELVLPDMRRHRAATEALRLGAALKRTAAAKR